MPFEVGEVTDSERDVPVADDRPVAVSIATEADRASWDAFVRATPGATGYHEWMWRTVIERSFGHECPYLLARQAAGGSIVGVLPLVQINSVLFGRTLTSLPFLNYGGVVATSDAAGRALVEAARTLLQERRCRHVELRHAARLFADLPCRQHKVSMRLPLAPGLWERLDRKVRNQVRKAEKSNLAVFVGGEDLLDDFYTVFARNMRDLGTPVYARQLFAEVVRAFPDRARVFVTRLGDKPIAGGLTFRTGTMVEIPWASSIREYNSLCANHLMYWRAIETAMADGADVFDFGRSTPGEGTFKFKEQWGAQPLPLYWEYCLQNADALPDQSPKNPKYRLMIETWKRMPLWAANAIGPRIVRSIP